MIRYDEVLQMQPYAERRQEKEKILTECLSELTEHHYAECKEYRKMMIAAGFDPKSIKTYYDIPFLPVRLFKEYDLKSVAPEDVVKTMTSSGTTGQQVSKIYLDRDTSANQTRALVKIVSSYLGSKRLPMVILDTSAVLKDRKMFSARGAGILGFSMFAKDKIYALKENMDLDVEGMENFLKKYHGSPVFLFGFTFMVWQHFYRRLAETGYTPDLSRAVLIHGGGWKKLASEAISRKQFKDGLASVCKITRVYDYYGMVEQTGNIYMECEYGYLHTPVFSDVIVRRPMDFSVADIGEEGIIEVVSILPRSYPGHALLTEDMGVIIGEDDCPCGRKGKYFKVCGRMKNTELRGCSDTYAAEFS